MHQSLQSAIMLKPAGWAFQPPEGKNRKKKRKEGGCKYNRRGLFFSINNSFCRTGEGVKLDILEERSLQQRMTRNNEEILPQTLSPAEWRTSQQRKIKKLLNTGFIRGNNSPPFVFNKYLLQSHIKKTPVKCSVGALVNNTNTTTHAGHSPRRVMLKALALHKRQKVCVPLTLNVRKSSMFNIYTYFFFFTGWQWGQTGRH